MSKLTPPQHQLLKQLRQAGPIGVPIERTHSATLTGLVRRGLATVSFGKAYRVLQHDGDDAA